MADQIVDDAVAQIDAVRHTVGTAKAMRPAQPRQAQAAPAELAKLLMDITLFASETSEMGVEAGPLLAAAGEQSQPLHRNLERLALRIFGPLIDCPHAPHVVAPHRVEVRRQ